MQRTIVCNTAQVLVGPKNAIPDDDENSDRGGGKKLLLKILIDT